MNETLIVATVQAQWPHLLAVYAFGSRVQGTAGPASDLDLAVLVAGRADPMLLWELSQQLANVLGCDVDLLDLRAVSTVMQYQIITTGKVLWAKDAQAAIFESFILSEKTALDEARAGIIIDIQRKGTVYGR
ncbi:type VII toxin-antitoxin system MntA family adenylyltransferase antitoxin [Candidatus Contendibacter odensensis]|uniref:DNA polymerase subunit beta n=1 Tax=Candidatus Contendobacter odensis Run_B_J11 TaxID=1400861 RepID=A0A7U7GAA9_9GAMM|nr:nucleotidyltransferase domain-containing protein [Candidatus Contendobacter odensis]MBK8750154.1 nucleotidyltransferase domain-containing protein [Candidatus Competibacteraceae bacterium]CDH44644.1 DNA polymerase subunit beta [Candidatus Contendobacter odensis Run_B_J11]